ncbi:TatD family hydrolase [Candidatus Peregrinibacteria bacterium]|nr:MAG: TatD family hydrolase [Candidatus Peregrinibacteria bacterium]
MLVDTHCHLDFPNFEEDRAEVIARAKELGVERMITIGCHPNAITKTLEIAQSNEGVFAAVGIHPDEVSEDFSKDFERIVEAVTHPKVVAIGETGFDFYREGNPSELLQRKAFFAHIELAKKTKKPLIIHLREAEDVFLSVLADLREIPFVIHCFSGNMAFAKQIFDAGGMISFPGILTFKNAHPELLEVAKNASLDRVFVETDSPFLAPVPKRGKRNEPGFTRYTAEFLAKIREEDFSKIAKQTTTNAERFFGLKNNL